MNALELTIALLKTNDVDSKILDRFKDETPTYKTMDHNKEHTYFENDMRLYSVSKKLGIDHEFSKQIASLVNQLENLPEEDIIKTVGIYFKNNEALLVYTNTDIDKLYGYIYIKNEYYTGK